MALSEGAKDGLHLRQFLGEVNRKLHLSTVIKNDSKGARSLAHNEVTSSRSKHIDLWHHFIRTTIQSGCIMVVHTPTSKMPAVILTKGLSKDKHYNCLVLLNMDDH